MASQSSNIGFFLIAGFIVYITVRGELPAYLCVIGFGSNCPTPPAATPTNQPVSTSQPTQQNSTSVITAPPSNGFPNLPSLPVDSTIGSVPQNNPPIITLPPVLMTISPPDDGSSDNQCYDAFGNLTACGVQAYAPSDCVDEYGFVVSCD